MIYYIRLVTFLSIPLILSMLPVLFGGKVFATGDILGIGLPHLDFLHESLKQNQSFLWNPYILGGFPSFSSLVGGFFAPLNLVLFKFLPTVNAYNWAVFLNLLLAAVFTALFLRKMGLTLWAQVLGGLTFVFSQWFMIADLGVVNSFPFLPLLFWMIYLSKEKNWPVVVGGLALGMMWLSAHYQWQLIILSGALLFAWYLGRKVLAKFVLMNLLGFLVGAIQLIPAWIYSRFSARGSALSFTEASAGAITVFDLPRIFLPYFRLPFGESGGTLLYLGFIPLFLAILGMVVRDRLVRFFFWTLVLCLLLALKFSPLFWIIHQLPIFSSLREPSRWLFLGFFAASVLAAFGLDRFPEITGRTKSLLSQILGVLGMVVIGISLLLSVVLHLVKDRLIEFLKRYFEIRIYARTSRLPLEHYFQTIENMVERIQEIFDLASPGFLFSIIFLFFGILLTFLFASNLRVFSKKLLVFVSGLNFILIFLVFHPIIAQKSLKPAPEIANLILEHEGRVITFLPGFSQWSKLTVPYGFDPEEDFRFSAETLTPNVNIFYRISHIDGYENLMPKRLARLLALLGSDRATVGEKLADLKTTPEEKAKIFSSRKHLLDLLGVQYIISAYSLEHLGLVKIQEFQATRHNIPIFLYLNHGARPLVYLSQSFEIVKPDEDLIYQKLFEVSSTSVQDRDFLECKPCPNISPTSGPSNLQILEQKNNELKIFVETDSNLLLVFAQSRLPGWEAYLDGKLVQLYTVNSVFMGLVVPKGKHEVHFLYNYPNILQYALTKQ